MSDSGLTEQLVQAQALHSQGQLADAREMYEQVLQLAPDLFEALNALGVISGQGNDLPRCGTVF